MTAHDCVSDHGAHHVPEEIQQQARLLARDRAVAVLRAALQGNPSIREKIILPVNTAGLILNVIDDPAPDPRTHTTYRNDAGLTVTVITDPGIEIRPEWIAVDHLGNTRVLRRVTP